MQPPLARAHVHAVARRAAVEDVVGLAHVEARVAVGLAVLGVVALILGSHPDALDGAVEEGRGQDAEPGRRVGPVNGLAPRVQLPAS